MYQNADVIISVCSSVFASIVEAIAISLWDVPKKHLPVSFITSFCVILVVGHCFALAAYLYFIHDVDHHQSSEDDQPSGSSSGGESEDWRRLPWIRNAAVDTAFALVGVGFHFIPDTSVPSLVLLAAVTFDAFAIVKLLYPVSHVGLVAAATAIVLEVATNVNKLVLPFAVGFSIVLIVGRASFIAKSGPHNSPVLELELNEV